MYEVELADGRVKEYGANIIAENMLTQVDSDGFSLSLMEGIIDYKCDDSGIPKIDKYITNCKGAKEIAENHSRLEIAGQMEGSKRVMG